MKLLPDSWQNGAGVRLSLAVTALLGGFARLSAQEPPDEPVRNLIKFTMHISGTGSDPAPTGNGSAVLESTQSWTYDRSLDGWFEVAVVRRKEETGGGPRQVIEFSHKKGQRHEVIGTVADQVNNFERSGAEDFNSVYVDYRAKETTDWSREIASLPSSFGVVLDATNKRWIMILEPHFLIGDYLPMADFQAEAHYLPNSPGGFGDPWDYMTSDRSLLMAGDRKQILLRYHPDAGVFGMLPYTAPERQNVEAKYRDTVATGHVDYNVPRPDGAKGTWTMRCVVDWEARTELPDVELEVRCPKYDKWRPTATDESAAPGAGRASGPGLDFSAKLRRADGNKKAKLPKIESMEWRLSGTSREPGIAMNFPYKSDDKRPDMEIVASDLTSPEDDTAQAVVIRGAGETTTAATVMPFDWGGWTTLRVTAKLDDGRTIVGRLKGAPSAGGPLENIPVPASHPGSHIALSWLREKCPGWKSDAADEDKLPAGRPGVDGDGFSVYEEYRGFYLYRPREHVSTEPAKKDLFVFNNAGFRGGIGLAHFWRLSKLAVRILLPGDLPRAEENERTVNCNIGEGATNGPQTAIYIALGSFARPNDIIPENSRPKTVPAIFVPAENTALGELSSGLYASASLEQTDELNAAVDHMVMQALFQTVGVDRPGPSGDLVKRVFVPAMASADGKPYFTIDGKRVVVERESDGFDFAIAEQRWWDPPLNGEGRSTVRYVLIGTKGSAHSGPENCVMRDWFADYYVSRQTRDTFPLYRLGPLEKPGTQLGTTRKGTGINLSTRFDEPAYGDSKVAEPANKQLVVRDNAP